MEPPEWYYLDCHGKEFGPFSTAKMHAWFTQDFFPVRGELLVRAQEWTHHKPVREIYPDGEAFVGSPRGGRQPAAPGAIVPVDQPHSSDSSRSPAHYGPPAYGPPAIYGPPPMGPRYGAPPPGPFGPGPAGHYGGPPAMPHGYGYPLPMPGHYGQLPLPWHGPHGHMAAGAAYGQLGYGHPHRHDEHRAASRSRSPQRGRRRGGEDGRPFKPHHPSVPKVTDLEAKFSTSSGPATTGMLRNIPNKYMQESLLEEIDAQGFAGTYDFFYLPMDVRNNANVGYAFINFLDPPDLERFCKDFEGYQFKRAGSKKIATVSPAVVQGLKQNVQNLMSKRVAQGEYRPIVLRNGQRVELEQAAKELLS
mmetsp:Transcript_59837/g.129661  ORF Transcript_59837/g.129661 Transcript_59837/m.129661 type:complete len:362 (-) Transcript_59837:229-1314(-)